MRRSEWVGEQVMWEGRGGGWDKLVGWRPMGAECTHSK